MPRSPAFSDPVLHILLALSDRARHGYAIVQEIEASTEGKVVLGTGTLYTALKRLRAEGLIEEEAEGRPVDGRRRRTYRLTAAGRRVLEEQTVRLKALLDHARQKRVLGAPRHAS